MLLRMATLSVRNASDRTRRRLAWAAPVVIAGAVAAGVALTSAPASGASPNLKPRTAAELLVALQRSTATALSGQITETAALGLPSLPGGHSSASLSWQTFVTGSHSARVWVDGKDKQRVALIGELSEADVVHNGPDVWTYTSSSNTVTRTTLRQHKDKAVAEPSAADMTPAAVAARVLKAVEPSTKVSVDSSRIVAKHAAYTLVLRPRDTASTVRKVTIAIDAKRFVPLQVQVFGAASSPAFEVGFTTISFTRPAASTFRFHTPAGATTSTNPFGSREHRGEEHGDGTHEGAPTHPARVSTLPKVTRVSAKPKVIGSGWTAVLELPPGAAGSLGGGTLRDLTTATGKSGERLLHTALVNAVLLPDGRTFVGAVSPAVLEHVAATTPR